MCAESTVLWDKTDANIRMATRLVYLSIDLVTDKRKKNVCNLSICSIIVLVEHIGQFQCNKRFGSNVIREFREKNATVSIVEEK